MAIFDEFKAIGEICRSKYHRAQAEDRDFDIRKYIWVLGAEVVDILKYYNERCIINPFVGEVKVGGIMELMGISIKIDYDLPNRISLFKEVRDD